MADQFISDLVGTRRDCFSTEGKYRSRYITTPSGLPPPGYTDFYFKEDNCFYNLTSSGVETNLTCLSGTDAFYAYSTSDTAIGSSWTDIALHNDALVGASYSRTGSNAEVIFSESNTYEITYYLTINITAGTSRTESEVRLSEDIGFGYSDVPGSYSLAYHRQLNQGGTNASLTVVRGYKSGDKIKIIARRSSGSSSLVASANMCGLKIKPLQARGSKGDKGEKGDPGGTTIKMVQCRQATGTSRQDCNTASWIAIDWDAEDYKDPLFSHSNSVNSSRITVTASGVYKISYCVSHEDQSTARRNVVTQLRSNGLNLLVPGKVFSYSRNTTDEWASNTSPASLHTLNVGDYIEVVARREGSNGQALTVQDGSCWILMEYMN